MSVLVLTLEERDGVWFVLANGEDFARFPTKAAALQGLAIAAENPEGVAFLMRITA